VYPHGNDSWNGLSAAYNSTNNNDPKATLKNATATVANMGTIKVASGSYWEMEFISIKLLPSMDRPTQL